MAKDDYFKIVYVVLKELYECKRANEKINLSAIAPGRFEAEPGYMLEIFEELIEAGYIKGVIIENTKTGRHITSPEDMTITMKGIEYLQENSKMKKVCEALKTIKDIAPGL